MDKGTKRNLAVTAGLTAVLALSPVAGPVVTALAVDSSDGVALTKSEEHPDEVTLTFYYCDGTDGFETRTCSYNSLLINNKPSLSRDGYEFGGWYTDSEYSESSKIAVVGTRVTEDMTLYAKWNKNPTLTFYNEISYDDMSGVEPLKIDVAKYAKSYAKPSDPTIPSDAGSNEYVFDGWFTDPSLDEQYRFTSWNSGFTQDTTLYAKWKKFPTVTYYLSPESKEPCLTVTVDPNARPDDVRDSLNKSAVAEYLGDKIPEGYSIEGLYLDKDYTELPSSLAYIDEDTTLYIKFDHQPTVTFQFVDEGGETLDTIAESVNLFDYADAQKAPEGYRIDGYAVGEGPFVDDITSYEVKGDTTITVKCVKLATVTFNYGDADIDDTTQVVDTGKTVSKPADPTREGYTFGGWYTDEECTEGNEYDFTNPVTGDLTLYAKWIQNEEPTEPEQPGTGTEEPGEGTETPENPGTGTEEPVATTHKVTFDDCLASTENAVVEVEDGKTVAKPADPECEGFTFEGWYSDTDLTQEWDFSAPVTEDMTLWAKWVKNGVDGAGVTDDTKTPAAPSKDADKTASDKTASDKGALPSTGDATMAVSGLGALGTAVAGLGAFLKRRH